MSAVGVAAVIVAGGLAGWAMWLHHVRAVDLVRALDDLTAEIRAERRERA